MKLKKKNWNVLCDVSFWDIAVPDYFRVEISKTRSASFQTNDGPFSVAARKDGKAAGDVRKLPKEWFHNMMPNGEKMLQS